MLGLLYGELHVLNGGRKIYKINSDLLFAHIFYY